MLYDNQLYKRGFSTPLLKCVNLEQGNHILQEIHERIYRNHVGGQSLAYKALRQGYFWLTMKTDTMSFSRNETSAKDSPAFPDRLTLPFAVWGIDLICPMPTAGPTFKYTVVVVDYFTKWA